MEWEVAIFSRLPLSSCWTQEPSQQGVLFWQGLFDKRSIVQRGNFRETSNKIIGKAVVLFLPSLLLLNLQERNLNTDWKSFGIRRCSYNFFIYCLKLTLQSHFEIDFEIAYLKLKKAKCKCNKMYLDANFIISSGLLK